ncbi:helix-turn-helix domain-containing protein [Streptomyces jumonjinensis]
MSDLVGDARAWSPDAQEAVRLLAVSALVEGRDRAEAAALFKVSARAVDNWWVKWQAGGRDALLSRARGRRVGEHHVLSEAEQAAVRHACSITSRPTWDFRVNCGRGGRQVS